MRIGDRLELLLAKAEKPGSCLECVIGRGIERGVACNFYRYCSGKNAIFKLLPKQNAITFENVDSNILCNDKGEATMLNLRPLITAENLDACHEIYKTNKNVKVNIIVRWEK